MNEGNIWEGSGSIMERLRVSRSTIQNDTLSLLFDTDPPQLISSEVCKERGYKFLPFENDTIFDPLTDPDPLQL